jgi:hypothetical protein
MFSSLGSRSIGLPPLLRYVVSWRHGATHASVRLTSYLHIIAITLLYRTVLNKNTFDRVRHVAAPVPPGQARYSFSLVGPDILLKSWSC